MNKKNKKKREQRQTTTAQEADGRQEMSRFVGLPDPTVSPVSSMLETKDSPFISALSAPIFSS